METRRYKKKSCIKFKHFQTQKKYINIVPSPVENVTPERCEIGKKS